MLALWREEDKITFVKTFIIYQLAFRQFSSLMLYETIDKKHFVIGNVKKIKNVNEFE